jgi:cobalt-precorrin-5B (C1)-methyltransferase
MKLYTHKGTKKLAYGYTTGSCAAAASKAAAYMYFTGEAIRNVKLMTPKRIELDLDVLESKFVYPNKTLCAVKKQSGDDPDVTNGVVVYSELEFLNNADIPLTINIDGGAGVGRVTKKGLEQPIGAAAINSVPRKMIADEVRNVCEEYDFNGIVNVVISIPEGIELANKTFNPRLGIEGGISVLGTSGIVEPMSEKALVDTIRVEMKVGLEESISENKDVLLVALGNYGRNFMLEKYGIDIEKAIKCSNYIGETIDIANELGVKKLLLVGHIGKLIKVSGGIMNTHSSNADARLELLSAHALRIGAGGEVCRKILDSVTTDEALEILKKNNMLESTMEEMIGRISYYVNKRSDLTEIEVIVFSNELGELAHTKQAYELLGEITGNE